MNTQLDGHEIFESHFRGRQLKGVAGIWQSSMELQHTLMQTWLLRAGASVELPQGFKLLHLSNDSSAPDSRQGSTTWQVQQSCQHFMYW